MANNNIDEDPLPLHELRHWISQNTYDWIELQDAKDLEWNAELAATTNLFQNDKDEKEERIRQWSSSVSKPDGVGGYDHEDDDDVKAAEADAVEVQYILSFASGGHGDDVWAASRHVANLFANADKCRHLLSPMTSSSSPQIQETHPLSGLNVIELGAGAGIPSWTAMNCGARVVCTDQAICNRIRCLAECAERNWRACKSRLAADDPVLEYVREARVCPYNWGTCIDDEIDKDLRFDVVVAADCIYMPEGHGILLDSIQMLLAEGGIALLPFCLHGNTNDDNVWAVVDLAKSKGFHVEKLEAQQLTPQYSSMDSKRGLVHTLRLTRS